MSYEVEAPASDTRISFSSRLIIARLLFLAGALGCCAYAVSLGMSRERLLNILGARGTIVAFLVLALEHVAWWWALRNPDQSRIDWAKKTSYIHVVLFISAIFNNSPQDGYVLLAMTPPVPDDLVMAVAPPLLVIISSINALVLRSAILTKGGDKQNCGL